MPLPPLVSLPSSSIVTASKSLDAGLGKITSLIYIVNITAFGFLSVQWLRRSFVHAAEYLAYVMSHVIAHRSADRSHRNGLSSGCRKSLFEKQ